MHFYTVTVGEVFLEFVERRGGYDGYGASNAPSGWRPSVASPAENAVAATCPASGSGHG